MHRKPKMQCQSAWSECSSPDKTIRERASAQVWLRIRGTPCCPRYFDREPPSEIPGTASVIGRRQSWDLRAKKSEESVQRRGSLLSAATALQSPTARP